MPPFPSKTRASSSHLPGIGTLYSKLNNGLVGTRAVLEVHKDIVTVPLRCIVGWPSIFWGDDAAVEVVKVGWILVCGTMSGVPPRRYARLETINEAGRHGVARHGLNDGRQIRIVVTLGFDTVPADKNFSPLRSEINLNLMTPVWTRRHAANALQSA